MNRTARWLTRGTCLVVAGSVAVPVGGSVAATSPLRPHGSYRQVAKLTPPGSYSRKHVGAGVAVSGRYLAVSAPYGHHGHGAIYLYRRPKKGWTHVTKPTTVLTSSRLLVLGLTFVMTHRTIASVAEQKNHAGQAQMVAAVFTRPRSGWSHARGPAVLGEPHANSDSFGTGIAATDSVVAVSATGSTTPSAFVYARPRAGWRSTVVPTARLRPSDGQGEDDFGCSVAAGGSIIVVGGCDHSIGKRSYEGQAYVYVKPTHGWAAAHLEQARLRASNGVPEEQFGYAVAVSGQTILVTGPYRSTRKAGDAGGGYVFRRPRDGWTGIDSHSGFLAPRPSDANALLGWTAAISGRRAILGEPSRSVGKNVYQGEVVAYTAPGGRWPRKLAPSQALHARHGKTDDYFGASLAINNSTIVIGAPHTPPIRQTIGEQREAAYVFGA